jgi:DNA (cytosine-5)-methyltransferase 1
LNYLSVCSGIEAATVAWHPLGWNPVGFAEIEPFPSAVLAHHYPHVTNFGDMTNFKEWNLGTNVDLLVGGTPCQSFSVAGLRKGLEDPRGNLALTYCGILDRLKPQWCVWENVPGVLSSSGGRDFGSFLGALGELGYGFAYRVLDAQYFGVAQRRRRVFVVGYLGDWRPAAEVLFESDCLRGNPPPSREKREGLASYTPSSIAGYREGVGTLRANGGDIGGGSENLIASRMVAFGEYVNDDTASAMKARDYKDATDLVSVYETHPADSRVRDMGEVCQTVTSRWGTGGGNVPLVQRAFRKSRRAQSVEDHESWVEDGKANTINLFDQGDIRTTHAIVTPPTAYSIREDATANNFSATPLEVTPALQALRPSVQSHHAQTFLAQSVGVRRLTPIECERLQGFGDNYTNVPWRKAEESPDSQRYKALGNSMAVPVMAWIGRRINEWNS